MSKRSFTIDHAEVPTTDFSNSRFESREPRGAAMKAARRLFDIFPKKKEIKFTIRETTQGSAGRKYTYYGLREKLEKPVVLQLGDREVTYEHKYKVRSCGMTINSK